MAIPGENEQALNIGSQQNQQTQYENPIKKFRKPTNRWFLIIAFIPILVLWITACLTGFFADYNRYHGKIRDEYMGYINAPVTNLNFMLPMTLFFCIVETCIFLLACEKSSKACVYISLVIMILYTISCCLRALQFMLGNRANLYDPITTILDKIDKDIGFVIPLFLFYVLIYILPNCIYTIIGIISFFKIDKSILCDITNYSSRLILRSPSLLMFTALMTILKFLVFSLILNAIIVQWLSKRDDISTAYAICILIGGLSMINVINNYVRMVISEYTVQSFWAKDEKISIATIAMRVFGNHIGTAMFASTTIISFFATILQAFKHKPSWIIKESYIYIVTKFFLAMSPDTAVIFTAIYGKSFLKSYQETFDTVLRRCMTYMAMLMVLDGFFSIIFLLLSVPVSIIISMSSNNADIAALNLDLSRIIYGFFYSYLAFELLISSTMKAQLINKIIILNKEDPDVEEVNLNENR